MFQFKTYKLIISLGALFVLFLGWNEFWFLTDDAYIAFRYISNRQLGFGYVWNPPPFLPVEGYTSFLWIVLLDVFWTVTGVAPPRSANWISLLFSAATLFITLLWFNTLFKEAKGKTYCKAVLLMLFVGILSNKTFLVWSSSGLETALFNFLFLSWLFVVYRMSKGLESSSVLFAFISSGIALTRPEGILYYSFSLLIQLRLVCTQTAAENKRTVLRSVAILFVSLLVPAHILGRYIYYGEFLPNTYFAKHLGAWPSAGWRYFSSFLIENGLVVWLVVGLVCGVVWWKKSLRQHSFRINVKSDKVLWPVALSIVLFQVFYYTLVIGGDHFEYRIYSNLVPLIYLSFLYFCDKIFISYKRRTLYLSLAFLLFLFFSLPIPWMHWTKARTLTTRQDSVGQIIEVSKMVPESIPFAKVYVQYFDKLQQWLTHRAIAIRHHVHKIFWQQQKSLVPRKRVFKKQKGNSVVLLPSPGVSSWYFPWVYFLDQHGLNDYVVARSPFTGPNRLMAHDRLPPPGYVKCFKPNTTLSTAGARTRKRDKPLSSEAIVQCENVWRKRIKYLSTKDTK